MSRRLIGVQVGSARGHHRPRGLKPNAQSVPGIDPSLSSMHRVANGSSTRSPGCCAIAAVIRSFSTRTLVLPTEEHFPDRGMSGHAGVAALFRRVRDHAGMADWPCVVEPEPQDTARHAGVAGSHSRHHATSRVRSNPRRWSRRFAHELARYLVETFEERAARWRAAARAGDRGRRGIHGVRPVHGELGVRVRAATISMKASSCTRWRCSACCARSTRKASRRI